MFQVKPTTTCRAAHSVVSWSTLLVLSGPVNFEMFTLSLVHLKCVHDTSPVHFMGRTSSKFLHLPHDDHLTMMYVRFLVRSSSFDSRLFIVSTSSHTKQ